MGLAKGLDEGGAPDEAMLASGEAEEDALVIGELQPEARKVKHLGPRETDIKPPPNPPGSARTGRRRIAGLGARRRPA